MPIMTTNSVYLYKVCVDRPNVMIKGLVVKNRPMLTYAKNEIVAIQNAYKHYLNGHNIKIIKVRKVERLND